MSKLPLVARKNIKENEEKTNEAKEKLQKAVDLSSEVTFDIDYAALNDFCDKQGYTNKVGDVMTWFIDALVSTFERNFSDDTAKAAIQAAWTTGVVRFQLGTLKKGESKYGSLDVENGDLVHTIYSLSNVGNGMAELLDKLSDSSSGLSVKATQNVKAKEEERTELLEKIKESLDLSCDVTLDIDWPLFSEKADKEGYKDKVADVISWFLEPFASCMQRKYKEDEIAKAALQAAWTTGVLRFEWGTLKKNESKYNECHPRDGDVVVTLYSFSNASYCGEDLVTRLTDGNLNVPLVSAQNIKSNQEKREEHLTNLQESVGLSNEVTIDIDWSAIDTTVTKLGYKPGDVIEWILEALDSNVKRICQEEMTKEAVAEAWTTGVIRLEENKKIKSYHNIEFVNGDLVIQYKPDTIATNTSYIGGDIESKL